MRNKLLFSSVLLAASVSLSAQKSATITLHADQGTQVIPKEIYGQFAEHLGTCIYGGLWVGENSDIPNIKGYRTDAVSYTHLDGSPVAMVHCNNCTSDLNAWINLFKEYQELLGIPVDMNEVYGKLYNHALTGNADCGGLISFNYISGEPVTGFADGRPMLSLIHIYLSTFRCQETCILASRQCLGKNIQQFPVISLRSD